MKLFFSLFFVTAFILNSSIAQNNQTELVPPRKCGTGILNQSYEAWIQKEIEKQNQFAHAKKTTTLYTIPIVFHILYTNQAVGSSYNLSQAQINSQITILNQDFRKTNTDFNTWATQSAFVSAAADCEIEFCAARVNPDGNAMLEPGINRIKCSDKGFTNPPHSDVYIDGTIKPNTIWDPTKYFNIWVVYMNDGTLGYAQFPDVPNGTPTIGDISGWGSSANTDGVVIDYRYIGNMGTAQSPFNKGRTTVHEVGHWLGLRHINGDSNCGNDYCADTPAQSSLTNSCPSVTGNTLAANCGTASPNPPGRMYQNYMDYSEDRCLVMFTANQKARMQACMANCERRITLNASNVCTVTNLKEELLHFSTEIFPNPSSGEVYVTYNSNSNSEFQLSIVNAIGQEVYFSTHNPSKNSNVKIDMNTVPKGIYFITITSSSNSITKRLIIQ